ncbi:hypothetical protein FXW30_05390 [Candidatus Liberibacter asiaticus]|nr:hypothetical protein FXW32_05370 [Candidatus Liberibacter asiaticus]KAE9514964.1 hypothetical protein FXW26_05250 [Candidatus Liberibacter asiaticus]KAE9519149.1 hypothetical protein FXW29_05400 [Candidatus Liberibacter asiaticus]KAE9520196.1 hypothetical protein FXW30_05390 [Candidatus Liberibacter asiaticus]
MQSPPVICFILAAFISSFSLVSLIITILDPMSLIRLGFALPASGGRFCIMSLASALMTYWFPKAYLIRFMRVLLPLPPTPRI